jgi:hypothetical protein
LRTGFNRPEYSYINKQQIAPERKEDMNERGLSSPDLGDAVAMTFAVNMEPQKPENEQCRYPLS